MKVGVPWVPLDAASEGRLQFIVGDADVELILCEKTNAESLSKYGLIIDVDPFLQRALVSNREAGPSTLRSTVGRVGSEIAYVYYTSGSTGQPKGVLGSHRAMLNRFEWMYQTYPFHPGEVM
jgi:non-ribosomal peptide synthetase component F